MKMSYYKFNREEILQKAKDRYSKEKAPEYYLKNKEAIKKSQRMNIKTCQKKKTTRLKSIKENDISISIQYKNEALQSKLILFD